MRGQGSIPTGGNILSLGFLFSRSKDEIANIREKPVLNDFPFEIQKYHIYIRIHCRNHCTDRMNNIKFVNLYIQINFGMDGRYEIYFFHHEIDSPQYKVKKKMKQKAFGVIPWISMKFAC